MGVSESSRGVKVQSYVILLILVLPYKSSLCIRPRLPQSSTNAGRRSTLQRGTAPSRAYPFRVPSNGHSKKTLTPVHISTAVPSWDTDPAAFERNSSTPSTNDLQSENEEWAVGTASTLLEPEMTAYAILREKSGRWVLHVALLRETVSSPSLSLICLSPYATPPTPFFENYTDAPFTQETSLLPKLNQNSNAASSTTHVLIQTAVECSTVPDSSLLVVQLHYPDKRFILGHILCPPHREDQPMFAPSLSFLNPAPLTFASLFVQPAKTRVYRSSNLTFTASHILQNDNRYAIYLEFSIPILINSAQNLFPSAMPLNVTHHLLNGLLGYILSLKSTKYGCNGHYSQNSLLWHMHPLPPVKSASSLSPQSASFYIHSLSDHSFRLVWTVHATPVAAYNDSLDLCLYHDTLDISPATIGNVSILPISLEPYAIYYVWLAPILILTMASAALPWFFFNRRTQTTVEDRCSGPCCTETIAGEDTVFLINSGQCTTCTQSPRHSSSSHIGTSSLERENYSQRNNYIPESPIFLSNFNEYISPKYLAKSFLIS